MAVPWLPVELSETEMLSVSVDVPLKVELRVADNMAALKEAVVVALEEVVGALKENDAVDVFFE